MEESIQNKNKKQWLVIVLIIFSGLASFTLAHQQFQLQDLQSDLDGTNAVVASQDYKSKLSWERLLCAETQRRSPDEVFAVYGVVNEEQDDYDEATRVMKVQCGAPELKDTKEFRILEIR